MKSLSVASIVLISFFICKTVTAQNTQSGKTLENELNKIEKQLYELGYELIARDSLNWTEKRHLARIYFYLGYDRKADSLAKELKTSSQMDAFTKKIIGINLYRRGKITKSRKWFEDSRVENQNDVQNAYYLNQIADRLSRSEREVEMAGEKMKVAKEIFNKSKDDFKAAKQSLKEAKETLKKEQARLRKEVDQMYDELEKADQAIDKEIKKE